MAISITPLSGGNTPADGSDPRTFPAIWNATATQLEGVATDLDTLEATVGDYDLNALNGVGITTPVQGDVLTYNGTSWVNGNPAGSIVQVVSVSTTTDFTVSSTSQTPWTGMSLSITPTSASSTILLIANAPSVLNSTVTTNNMILIRGGAIFESAEYTTPTANYRGSMSIVYMDSPATTSPTTYSVSVYNAGAGATGTYRNGSLTAMEVAG